jgi:hypothetical protein
MRCDEAPHQLVEAQIFDGLDSEERDERSFGRESSHEGISAMAMFVQCVPMVLEPFWHVSIADLTQVGMSALPRHEMPPKGYPQPSGTSAPVKA